MIVPWRVCFFLGGGGVSLNVITLNKGVLKLNDGNPHVVIGIVCGDNFGKTATRS